VIRETIVTSCAPDGAVHIAPMGVRESEGRVILAPFRPSTTLDNVLATGCATVNLSDDVRVFAGCLTGRRNWPTLPCVRTPGVRLNGALAHRELKLASVSLQPRKTTSSSSASANRVPARREFSNTTRRRRALVQSAPETSHPDATTSISVTERSRDPVRVARSRRERMKRPPAARASAKSPLTSASSISNCDVSSPAKTSSSSSITSGRAGMS